LNGSEGNFNINNMKIFGNYLTSGDFYAIQQIWDLNLEDLVMIGAFLGVHFESLFTYSDLTQLFAEGGGLISTRTVHQWLWNATDPLAAAVVPPHTAVPPANLLQNDSSIDEAKQRYPASEYYTGKDNITRIAEFILFRGQTVLEGVYPTPYNVGGTNEDGQFYPYLNPNQPLFVWNDDYLKIIKMIPKEYVYFRGVQLLRYFISNDTWAVNPQLGNSIACFSNVSGGHNQSQVFLSRPHMYGCPDEIRNNIVGMGFDPKIDLTTVDIEPHSGTVMRAMKCGQLNLYTPNTGWNNYFNTEFKTGIFYPIMIDCQHGEAGKNYTDLVKDKLYLGLDARETIRAALLSFSFSGMIAAVVLVFYGMYLWRHVDGPPPNWEQKSLVND